MRTSLSVSAEIIIPAEEIRYTFVRSSGPGGQNVNKVNTKVVLRWPVSGSRRLPDGVRKRFLVKYRGKITATGDLVLSSQRYRDQQRNIADCLDRLRTMILNVASPPKPRHKTRPSRSAVARRLAEKQKQAGKKQARRTPPVTEE